MSTRSLIAQTRNSEGAYEELARITVTRVKASELLPGDLFSFAGPEYWSGKRFSSIGEGVYFRTDWPIARDEADGDVYRLEIMGQADCAASKRGQA